MAEHTKGPWRVIKNTGIIVSDSASCQVAKVGDFADRELLPFNRARWEADAALIAAAPKLLRLREMSDRMAEDDGLWFTAETAAEAYLQQELRKLCAAIEE